MDALSGYANMKSHTTPIPTPAIVRGSASILVGAAVAVLTTGLEPGVRFGVVAACLALAILITFAHPYRGHIKAFRDQHNLSAMPTPGGVLPLFITWLALMLAPLLGCAPLWLSVLVWLLVSGWMFLTFPHIDGSRALAFVDQPRRNT
ncbi:hypothetical protein [Corynebacterium pacaense]|uniref:hypothetical protein n=1 Tax=Corynebacterium pacaense TaxID=1816684 RepID=UPI0009BBE1A8|nr:hypothetical protein [Corynebacterium pacaense]